jgi:membrane fusion protein, multidrug efflux system
MMKRVYFAALTALILTVSSCIPRDQEQTLSDTPQRVEPVQVITLDYQTIARTVDYTSTLMAWEELHLAPASPGRIEGIYVEVGNRVAKGDVLVQMDRTQLLQAEVQLVTLETDFKRMDTLQKVGSIPQQQYDQMKAQLDIARNNVAFLRENTQLQAPFSGVVSGKYFEPGEMFSGAPNPMVGKAAVLSLVQIDRLKTIVPVSERYFPMVKAGQEAAITLDLYPERVFAGNVFRIHPTIDPASRSFNVEIRLNNPENLLRPGMFCRVSLDIEEIQAILVPSIAVLKLQGSNERFLFIEENGVARRISVVMGRRYDDLVEVISEELKQGDQIIVSGQARLLNGMKVEVVKSN